MDRSSKKVVKAGLYASAAMLEVEGAVKMMEAAALRGDRAGVDDARAKAHAFLEAHLDQKMEVCEMINQEADRL